MIGLDITAYRNLKQVKCAPQCSDLCDLLDPEHEWTPGYAMKCSEKRYNGRAKGLNSDALYSFEEKNNIISLSYSAYQYFIDLLCLFKNTALAKRHTKHLTPFEELIDFSHSEGVIGPVVALKLYCDFVAYKSDIQEIASDSLTGEQLERFLNIYNSLLLAFKMASNNGAVEFS